MEQEKNSRKEKIKKFRQTTFKVAVYFFAVVGLMFSGVFLAMKLKLTYVKGGVDVLSQHFNSMQDYFARKKEAQKTVKDWASTDEWKVISTGFKKDSSDIYKASNQSGVSTRMILSSIVVEQFRYFNSNREGFKKLFQPLGILGNSTQFSYGIAGIKTQTAMTVEQNLKDKNSPYYLGPSYEHLLDFKTKDHDAERLSRLTDTKSHYYSYLYTGLLLKQEMKQWKKAGYSIDNRPEILATLFNLGFAHSNPNANPQTGGAIITVNGKDYTFGSLAFDFYYSNELGQEFYE